MDAVRDYIIDNIPARCLVQLGMKIHEDRPGPLSSLYAPLNRVIL